MPIYEYVCSACNHRTEILHGVHDAGPHFCPECGTEGSMRKSFAPPAIVFKGSGWAKKDRSATAPKKAAKSDGESKPASTTESKSDAKSGEASSSGTAAASD